jgi:hypothetical protein
MDRDRGAQMLARREFLAGGTAFAGLAAACRARTAGTLPGIDPLAYRARGDGATDDTRAVREALAHAIAAGAPLDGGDRLFAVSGDVSVHGVYGPYIRALRLRQLSPAQDRKTLFFDNCNAIRIDSLQILVGDAKGAGHMNRSGGLWIDGGSGHDVRGVDVSGHGKNSLIAIWNTRKSTYSGLHVHDAQYDDASARDDVLQGIFMVRNTDCLLKSPLVSHLGGNANSRFPYRFTRGIALSGNLRVTVADAAVANVDQGIDWSGTDGNTDCRTVGGKAYQCTTVGLKHGDSAVGCRASGVTAQRCGTHGFLLAAGGDPDARQKTSFVDLVDCTAIDIGALHVDFSDSRFGFSVEGKAREPHFPQGCRLIRCRAIDTQRVKTMLYGFYDNITYDPASTKANQLIDCSSEGYIKAARHGDWR